MSREMSYKAFSIFRFPQRHSFCLNSSPCVSVKVRVGKHERQILMMCVFSVSGVYVPPGSAGAGPGGAGLQPGAGFYPGITNNSHDPLTAFIYTKRRNGTSHEG